MQKFIPKIAATALVSMFLAAAPLTHGADSFTSAANSLSNNSQTATLMANGKVLLAGGNNGVTNAELYNPAANTWTATAHSMNTPRDSYSATLLPNGKVLVAGGYNGSYLNSAELYDPAADSWTYTSNSMSSNRDFHSATLLPNGKVLVAGGVSPAMTTELFDPATATWTTNSHLMNNVHANHTATLLLNGKVLVAGGLINSYPTNIAELYDPATDTWTNTAQTMNYVRSHHTATLLPNGKVLVAGGFADLFLSSAELYDPVTDTWTVTNSMGSARGNFTATLLPNGKVLVTGGEDNSSYTKSAELYNPVSGTWAFTTQTMISPRYLHNATKLPNGKVLIAGGSGTGATELYDMGTIVPATLAITAGNNQTTAVNTNVAINPSVSLTFQPGIGVGPGTVVTFAVATGGGSVTGGTAMTDVYGIATLASWKLGTTAGINTLSVTSGTSPAATFSATGTPDVPAAITVNVGNNQSATVNTNVAIAPSVLVKDQYGNMVADGTAVTFAVASGGGSVTGGSSTTTMNGIAALGSWKLGTTAGINTLSVTSGTAPAATISARGTPDVPAALTVNAGNNQSATVNTNVTVAPSVLVKDQFGNTVADGTAVAFAVSSGGGSVFGGNTTTANGIATLGSWKLGTTAGINTLSVTSGAAAAATIGATGTPDVPVAIVVNVGNNQSATVNANVAVAPAVLVTDQFGNRVSDGTPVEYVVSTGGGSVLGGNTTTTNGVAVLGSWKLGTTAGSNSLNVTSGTAPAATISATGTPDVPAALTVIAGNNQSASVNTNVAIAPTVLVKDQFGNIVADGTAVTFAVSSGGGSVVGGNTTTMNGIATLGSWKLGTTAGINTLSVTSGTAAAAAITAAGVLAVPAAITVNAGNNQSATVNTNVALAPSVFVKDQFGNTVADGTPVTFAVASGGGSVVGGSTTATSGIATLGSWKLGTTAGINTLSVTSGTAPAATISATGTPDVPAALTVIAGNNQSAKANTNVAIAPSVRVKDQFGNMVVDGTAVTFAVSSGGGSVVGGNTTTTNGIATLGSWKLGAAAGSNTLSVTSGTAPAVTIGATGTPGQPPAFLSAPSANPNPAAVTVPVSFSAAAASADNLPLTYTWNFGDEFGASGASVTHAYAAPGLYTASVIVSDGIDSGVLATVQVTVYAAAAIVGSGPDSDGDGFADAFETAVGTDPNSAASTPTGTAITAAALQALTMSTSSIKLNFAKTGSDTISFAGQLLVPMGFNPNGAKVYFDVGGVAKVLILNVKGSAKNGGDSVKVSINAKNSVVAAQTAKYAVTFGKGSFATTLAAAGLTNASARNVPVSVKFTFIFDNAVLQTTKMMSYTAKMGKTGKGK